MTKTFHEPARELPIAAEAEVIVAGGDPGGMIAALAAARTGATTLLIERFQSCPNPMNIHC